MLINKDLLQTTSHVEFVSYSGKWPNLCGGILTLKIDGKTVKFGYEYKSKEPLLPKFWKPACGECMDCTSTGEWAIDVSQLPEEYLKYAVEIDEVFNARVEHGHCGGCR